MDETIAGLLASAERGDAPAATALFAALYDQLRRMARRELARGGHGSVGATTLLHEAYLDIATREGAVFPDRHRFMAYASRVMRGLIIDSARRRRAQKRGGLFEITAIGTTEPAAVPDARELTRIGDALDELAKEDPLLAEVVDLKFFCGFSFAEIAVMRQVSERTVQRDWQRARIHLHRALRGASPM